MTPHENLLEVLFGAFGSLTIYGFVLGLVVMLSVILFIVLAKEKLILVLFSSELAEVTGIEVDRMNLYLNARLIVSQIMLDVLNKLKMAYPKITGQRQRELKSIRKLLLQRSEEL